MVVTSHTHSPEGKAAAGGGGGGGFSGEDGGCGGVTAPSFTAFTKD